MRVESFVRNEPLPAAVPKRPLSTSLAPEPVRSGGRVWGDMAQGCPASGAFQAIDHQPSLLKLDQACRAGGGLTVARLICSSIG